MAIPFIGQRFTPEEFEAYLAGISLTGFKPEFVTMHHTAAPSLAQRLNGFSHQHLLNLLNYYQNTLGWNGAPHIFIDDQPNGIIVFQRMDKRGVHAVSFNRNSWGLEMLGNFDSEEFNSGRGLVVQDMALQAIAIMNKKLGVTANTLRFHRDDPKTSKTCPGLKVSKAAVVAKLAAVMNEQPHSNADPLPSPPANTEPDWKVEFINNAPARTFEAIHTKDNRAIVPVREFFSFITNSPNNKANLKLDSTHQKVLMGSAILQLAELDANGVAWVFLRDFADLYKLKINVTGLVITLSI